MKQKNIQENRLLPRIVIDRLNWFVFLLGLIVIALGFILLSVEPWDNPISLSVAPVVLLIGYVVIIPIAIFIRSPKSREREDSGK